MTLDEKFPFEDGNSRFIGRLLNARVHPCVRTEANVSEKTGRKRVSHPKTG